MSTHFSSSFNVLCPECGASLAAWTRAGHACDQERVLDRQLSELRAEIDGFEEQFWSYLESAHGGLAQWLAERRRTQS